MCGIGGAIGFANAVEISRQLVGALRHRGPDDEGIVSPCEGVALAHTRLAILDLSSAGHQPMEDHVETRGQPNWITFNGEIYNFREIRAELERAGFRCRTNCDTEVILKAYRYWGTDCVTHFRGMFAFALIDAERRLAYFALDRLGIKPLYLCRVAGRGLVFASEVRALLGLRGLSVSSNVNRRAMESFFA